MARRKSYSKVVKSHQIRADHVKGMGDVVFIGFQCFNPECQNFIFVKESDIDFDDFEITCPVCGFVHSSVGETDFYDYDLTVNGSIVDSGKFSISHAAYICEAQRYKYCIVCNTLKPLEMFDVHNARRSKRQGECRLCKKAYNDIKNGTRLTDQHREAAQKRRLLLDVAGSPKIDSRKIRERFGYRCFNCGKDLSKVLSETERPLDHTLPVYYLWPLSTDNATLLCHDCNGEKSGKWPSEFYTDTKLRELSIITGIDYELLSGPATYNPEALDLLRDSSSVDKLLAKYASYIDELIKLRNRILKDTGLDFFESSSNISQAYIDRANSLL